MLAPSTSSAAYCARKSASRAPAISIDLQLLQLLQAGFPVALENSPEDLQAHLDTDEALQRAIVKVGRNPLCLGLTRGLGGCPQLRGLFR